MTPTSPEVSVLEYVPAPVPGGGLRFARDRDEARARGYAEGWSAGLRDAAVRLEQHRADLDAEASRQAERWHERQVLAVAALESAGRALHARQAPTMDDVADTVLDVALRIAEALLGRELAATQDAGEAALRRALDSVGAVRPLDVRLNPGDLAALDGVLVPDGVRLVADPSLASGDAVAMHAGGSVDARLAAGLARAREVLAP
jgi:flagellar assembly protein FliH